MSRVTRSDRLGFAYRMAAVILRPIMMLITRRDWRGTSNLDVDSGMVLAANHLSWFDPIVISHVLWDNGRPPRFLAKDSLFRMPVVGWVMGGFARRTKSDHVHQFRIDEASVRAGLADGLAGTQILQVLADRARVPVPQNVRYSLEEWAQRPPA